MAILALTSRVHTVTVYRSGALVTRRASLPRGPDGYPDTVRVAGLPLSLDDGSLRARIEVVQGGEVPVATGLRVALDVPDAGAVVEPPADARIDEARRQALKLQGLRDQLTAELELLGTLRSPVRPPGAEGQPPPVVPTASRLELLGFRHEEVERRQAERRQVQEELTAAMERLKRMEYLRDRASTARPARENELRKTVVVALSAREARAEAAWLELEYLVPGARWVPSYALELDAEATRGRLAVRALVCQATGEDWPGVALRLSTADAQSWAELPELQSLRIGRRQSGGGRRGWVPPPTGTDELFADYDRAMVPAPDESRFEQQQTAGESYPDAEMAMESYGAVDAVSMDLGKDRPAPQMMMETSAPPAEYAMKSMAMRSSMAPAAAPMPAAPGMARGKREDGMLLARSAGAPVAQAKLKKSGRPPRAPAAADESLRAAAELMDYGRLRLRGRDESSRGLLMPIAISAEYRELLVQLRVSLPVDVPTAIGQARSRADQVSSRSVPPRFVVPGPVDGFDYAYGSEFPLDVPSDGEFHGVTLRLSDGPVELKHVSVPRESADVFRVVAMANPLESPLLAGPVDVSVAGEFRLTAPMRTVPPRGRLELGLGVEPAIKVARNTRYREETGGLITSSLALEHEIVIDVLNHLKRRAAIEVRERIPVVREGDDQATVTVSGVSPPWKDYRPVGQDLKGGHAWNVNVEPGDKVQLKATYSIAIAAKNELVGGNRREG